MRKPIIVLTFAFAAGILLGQAFLYFPYSTTVFIVLAILCVLLLHRRALIRAMLFVLPGLFGIAGFLFSAAWLPKDHYTRFLSSDSATHDVTGRIVSALDRDPDRTGFTLEVTDFDGTAVSGLMRVSVRTPVTTIGYGDRLG